MKRRSAWKSWRRITSANAGWPGRWLRNILAATRSLGVCWRWRYDEPYARDPGLPQDWRTCAGRLGDVAAGPRCGFCPATELSPEQWLGGDRSRNGDGRTRNPGTHAATRGAVDIR